MKGMDLALGRGDCGWAVSGVRGRRCTGTFVTSRRVIVGMAPNRAKEVIVQEPGSTAEIPVVDGIFMRHDKSPYPSEQL